MKQVLQNLRTGETQVVDAPLPAVVPQAGLVQTAVSLVSTGTERMLADFGGKSLLGKARSRPDLVKQLIAKARREGILSTVEAAFNRLDQPMALGYSSAGTLLELGEGLQGFHVGQRVACGGGGHAVHAEYAVIPKNLMAPIPETVSFEAAAFATLGAIALHGFRLAEARLGECVVIIGLGLLGQLSVMLALAAGCRVLGADLDERRVTLARQVGAEAVLRAGAEEAAQAYTQGRGADAVLICADTPSDDPVELAGAVARDRAKVVAVGAVGQRLPRKVYYEKELTFVNSRSYGPGRYDPSYEEKGVDYPLGYVRWTEKRNMEAFLDLLANRRIDVTPLISHRFPIDQAPNAYALITSKTSESFMGVLLTYPENQAEAPATAPQRISSLLEAVPPVVKPAPPVERVRLGVLGAGNFASLVMLPALRKIPAIELVGIASASGASAQHAAAKYGFQYAASHAEQLLEDETINTIAILTRHHLHASQALKALAQGKHVFCEKPLALQTTELDELEEALRQPAGDYIPSVPLLMVGFNRRFAPLAVRLAEFLKDRREPMFIQYRVNAGFIPLNHWTQDPEQGGGRIVGEGCHFIDFLTFLTGEIPQSVHASALPDLGRYQEDNVHLTFTYPDGSIGAVSYLANGDKAFPKERVEVFCGGRVAVLDDFRQLTLVKNGKTQQMTSRLRQDKGHRAEWEAFARAILTGGKPPIPYEQLLGVSRAALAAVNALRRRKTIVILPGG